MRAIPALVLWMATLLPIASPWSAYAAQSGLSFALPLLCTAKNEQTTRCITGTFRPGLNVGLVGKGGICTARTAESLDDNESEDTPTRRTRVAGTDACLSVRNTEKAVADAFSIAVVGDAASTVRPATAKTDASALSKTWEMRARDLAEKILGGNGREQSVRDGVGTALSEAKPRTLKAADATVAIFDLQIDRMPWEPGPTVLLTKGGAFLLQGACTYGHMFFFVNDKLHLTYRGTVHCCGCGDINFFVYDVSGDSPALVYHNSEFSD